MRTRKSSSAAFDQRQQSQEHSNSATPSSTQDAFTESGGISRQSEEDIDGTEMEIDVDLEGLQEQLDLLLQNENEQEQGAFSISIPPTLPSTEMSTSLNDPNPSTQSGNQRVTSHTQNVRVNPTSSIRHHHSPLNPSSSSSFTLPSARGSEPFLSSASFAPSFQTGNSSSTSASPASRRRSQPGSSSTASNLARAAALRSSSSSNAGNGSGTRSSGNGASFNGEKRVAATSGGGRPRKASEQFDGNGNEASQSTASAKPQKVKKKKGEKEGRTEPVWNALEQPPVALPPPLFLASGKQIRRAATTGSTPSSPASTTTFSQQEDHGEGSTPSNQDGTSTREEDPSSPAAQEAAPRNQIAFMQRNDSQDQATPASSSNSSPAPTMSRAASNDDTSTQQPRSASRRGSSVASTPSELPPLPMTRKRVQRRTKSALTEEGSGVLAKDLPTLTRISNRDSKKRGDSGEELEDQEGVSPWKKVKMPKRQTQKAFQMIQKPHIRVAGDHLLDLLPAATSSTSDLTRDSPKKKGQSGSEDSGATLKENGDGDGIQSGKGMELEDEMEDLPSGSSTARSPAAEGQVGASLRPQAVTSHQNSPNLDEIAGEHPISVNASSSSSSSTLSSSKRKQNETTAAEESPSKRSRNSKEVGGEDRDQAQSETQNQEQNQEALPSSTSTKPLNESTPALQGSSSSIRIDTSTSQATSTTTSKGKGKGKGKGKAKAPSQSQSAIIPRNPKKPKTKAKSKVNSIPELVPKPGHLSLPSWPPSTSSSYSIADGLESLRDTLRARYDFLRADMYKLKLEAHVLSHAEELLQSKFRGIDRDTMKDLASGMASLPKARKSQIGETGKKKVVDNVRMKCTDPTRLPGNEEFLEDAEKTLADRNVRKQQSATQSSNGGSGSSRANRQIAAGDQEVQDMLRSFGLDHLLDDDYRDGGTESPLGETSSENHRSGQGDALDSINEILGLNDGRLPTFDEYLTIGGGTSIESLLGIPEPLPAKNQKSSSSSNLNTNSAGPSSNRNAQVPNQPPPPAAINDEFNISLLADIAAGSANPEIPSLNNNPNGNQEPWNFDLHSFLSEDLFNGTSK